MTNKFNKTYYLVRSLNNGLYKKYLNGDIVLQDIADEFDVSIQHVAAVIKENNIGNPSEEKRMHNDEERMLIKEDVENGLPIEYFKNKYKIFENITNPINVFNTMTRWVKEKQFKSKIPYITEAKLEKLILDINIMKTLKLDNMMPKKNRKTLQGIADDFKVKYRKISKINSYIKKDVDNLVPDNENELVRVIIRNLEIANIVKCQGNVDNTINQIAKDYNMNTKIIERIVDCKAYIDGSNIRDYLNKI